MSNNGPMFKMLENMVGGGAGAGGKANEALRKLLKSGIPGLEGLLGGGGKEPTKKIEIHLIPTKETIS